MSRRIRRQKKSAIDRQRAGSVTVFGSRRRWPWAAMLGLLVGGAVAFGLYTNRNDVVPIALPPLRIADIDGKKKPLIDNVALTRFMQHFRLPEIPDLNGVSAETAQDIHVALKRVAAQPDSGQAIGGLARVLQSHEYVAMALKYFTKAREIDPFSYEWAYYVGRIHADAYEFEPAIESYELAAELNPNYASTFLSLGNLYRQSGDEENARKAFQRFVSLSPESSHGYLGLAQIEFDRQEYQSAIDLLGDAISRNAKDFRAHNLLGQAYQHLGQTQKAQYHLAIVKNLDSRNQLTKHIFFDDPLYHRMLASNSTDAALTERFRAALHTHQPEVAIRLAKQLCKRHPDDADRFYSLAVAYKLAKRYKEALACAEESLRLKSGSLETLTIKAQLLMITRRNNDALKLLNSIAPKAPNSFELHYYRGAAQVLSNQYEAAVSSFRQAVRINEGSARAHVALAEALSELGRKAESLAEYRLALQLDPTNARAKQRLKQSSD